MIFFLGDHHNFSGGDLDFRHVFVRIHRQWYIVWVSTDLLRRRGYHRILGGGIRHGFSSDIQGVICCCIHRRRHWDVFLNCVDIRATFRLIWRLGGGRWERVYVSEYCVLSSQQPRWVILLLIVAVRLVHISLVVYQRADAVGVADVQCPPSL